MNNRANTYHYPPNKINSHNNTKINLSNSHLQLQEFKFNFTEQPIAKNHYPSLPPQDKVMSRQFVDKRKELIKQKIKFRMKEEIQNSLKKIAQKPVVQNSFQGFRLKMTPKVSDSFVYVKGQSFKSQKTPTNFSGRKLISFNQSRSSQKKSLIDIDDHLQGQKRQDVLKRRRIWSSAIKIRQKDMIEIKKASFRVNKSSIHFDKIDNGKIQPWQAVQENENFIESGY